MFIGSVASQMASMRIIAKGLERNAAQAAALSVGQFTLKVPRGCRISTLIFAEDPWAMSYIGSGMNAGWSTVLGTLLNDLGLEGFGIGTACWLHELPA